MRKLAVIGALAAGMFGLAPGAGAATVDTLVGGAMQNSDNACINIIALLSGKDCSYANSRYPAQGGWGGPLYATSYYEYLSIADGQTFRPAPNDGKLSMPLTGTFTVDDNGTPADGSDDKISGTFSFGAADRWVSTGNGDFALERWTSWDHTLAPTTVNFATPVDGGGFEYVIGVRGKPTPTPLTLIARPEEAFGTEYAPLAGDLLAPEAPDFWDLSGATLPVSQRIGIERSAGFGNTDDTGANLQPNAGATTTATLADYACLDVDDDCTVSFILFGTSPPNPPPNSQTTPGFTNLVLIVSTGPDGRVTTGEAYWTREYIIKSGPVIGNDPPNPNQWVTPNSWTGNRFTFKGCNPAGPIGEPDAFSVDEGSDNATLAVLANDTLGCTEPNTIAIVDPPANGEATVNGSSIAYTPDTAPGDFYDGPDSLTYTITDGATNVTSVTTVDITVNVVAPTAANCTGASASGAAASCTVVTNANLGSGTVGEHTVNAGAGTLGTCTASGAVLTFTPTPGGGNGTGGCSFTITDADGDESDPANFSVTVTANSGSSSGGGGPQLPGGGSSLDLLGLAALLAGLPLAVRRRRK